MSLIVWGHDLPPYQYLITITSIFWYHYTTQTYIPFCHTNMCRQFSFWEIKRKLTAIFWNSSTNENEVFAIFTQVSSINIRRQVTSGQVTDVYWAIGIWKGCSNCIAWNLGGHTFNLAHKSKNCTASAIADLQRNWIPKLRSFAGA